MDNYEHPEFSEEEAQEITDKLNTLYANYFIHAQKVKKACLLASGKDFFALRNFFSEDCKDNCIEKEHHTDLIEDCKILFSFFLDNIDLAKQPELLSEKKF